VVPAVVRAQEAGGKGPQAPDHLGALAKANLEKPRPKPPFDVTGVWDIDLRASHGFQFKPMPKLKPAAQALYDASEKAISEGKAFKDDPGECWPPGMPRVVTRVWPMQLIQLPTMIVMIHGFENSVRWIYLDGRPHTDPDIVVPSYNGDSIGHWEGDTLVVDTVSMEPKHHWIAEGVPVSDQFHIIERIKLTDGGKTLEDEFTLIDPVNWEGDWVHTLVYRLADSKDITEVECLPSTNEHLLSTRPADNIR